MNPIVLVTAGALLGGIAQTQKTPAIPKVQTTYENFVKLPQEQRLPRFARLTAESKALIIRTHAERWLADHRTRLSASQVDLVEQAIRCASSGAPVRLRRHKETRRCTA